MVLQGIIQQSIKTILLNESEWFASIVRNRKHSQEAFMVHVLVFILTWIIPSLISGNIVLCRCLSDKESACQCRRHRRHRFDPWVGKIPWSRKWQSTPVFLPGKSHGQKSLVGYSPWGHKELDMTDHTCKKPLALLWKKKKKQILRPPLILLNIT